MGLTSKEDQSSMGKDFKLIEERPGLFHSRAEKHVRE